jgi:hypothetical protein
VTDEAMEALRRQIKDAADEYTLVEVLAATLDRAIAAARMGRDAAAVLLYRVVAEQDPAFRPIADAVDMARRELESRGLASEPSTATEYARYLGSLPPHQRYLMLARQCLRGLAGRLSPAEATSRRQAAIQHYNQALQHGPLGKKDARILAGLVQSASPKGRITTRYRS